MSKDYKFSIGERVIISSNDPEIGIPFGTTASVEEIDTNALDDDILLYRVDISFGGMGVWLSDKEISKDLEYYRNESLNKMGI